ncbi:hypothetical protein [Streptomyces sp. B6B3]|uniref:hypothetical protein n=1 Tax=Streptomyces sp. B6B3 TaxID=3153570 RepID=UPI00325D599A
MATLEVEPASADRVRGPLPALTGRQLAGTSCVVCGAPLGLDTVRIGAVRHALAGGRDLVYPVRGCAGPCRQGG